MPGYLAVSARKDGFAPMTGFIRRSFQDGDIPASYTLAMHPVETLTGVVRDEDGRPVEIRHQVLDHAAHHRTRAV